MESRILVRPGCPRQSSANVSNVDVQRQPEANDSSPPSLPSSSTSEAVSVAVAVQPSSPASQEERLQNNICTGANHNLVTPLVFVHGPFKHCMYVRHVLDRQRATMTFSLID